jgi:hypothetical protein
MFNTLFGTLIEIVPCIFTKNHIITFELFEEKYTNEYYLVVSKSEENGLYSSYCFKYDTIPYNVKVIYAHAKKYSNTFQNKNDKNEIIISGTSLYTKTEHNYIIGRYTEQDYPVGKKFNFIYDDTIDIDNCNILYKCIVDKMNDVKSLQVEPFDISVI